MSEPLAISNPLTWAINGLNGASLGCVDARNSLLHCGIGSQPVNGLCRHGDQPASPKAVECWFIAISSVEMIIVPWRVYNAIHRKRQVCVF